jgi:hypothetical protein
MTDREGDDVAVTCRLVLSVLLKNRLIFSDNFRRGDRGGFIFKRPLLPFCAGLLLAAHVVAEHAEQQGDLRSRKANKASFVTGSGSAKAAMISTTNETEMPIIARISKTLRRGGLDAPRHLHGFPPQVPLLP